MPRRFRPTDAFVDESIRGPRYLMGCVSIAAKDISTTRAEVADLAIAHRRVHFHNESLKRRREILLVLGQLPLEANVFVCQRQHGVSEFVARAACLTGIVNFLQDGKIARVVVESRDDDRSDVDVIVATRRSSPPLVFEHRRGTDEPLLWIADGLTWAVGAGGQWRDLVAPIIKRVWEIHP
jgi:hypothetical protein